MQERYTMPASDSPADSGEEDLHALDDQNREDHAGDSRMYLTDTGNHLWFDDLNEAQLIQCK